MVNALAVEAVLLLFVFFACVRAGVASPIVTLFGCGGGLCSLLCACFALWSAVSRVSLVLEPGTIARRVGVLGSVGNLDPVDLRPTDRVAIVKKPARLFRPWRWRTKAVRDGLGPLGIALYLVEVGTLAVVRSFLTILGMRLNEALLGRPTFGLVLCRADGTRVELLELDDEKVARAWRRILRRELTGRANELLPRRRSERTSTPTGTE